MTFSTCDEQETSIQRSDVILPKKANGVFSILKLSLVVFPKTSSDMLCEISEPKISSTLREI